MAAFSAVLHRRRRGLPVRTSTRRKLCPLIGKLLGTRTPAASIKTRQHHPIVSPRKVYLSGRNPFPWPVTIRHKGLTIVRAHDSTNVTFPSGRSATAAGEAQQVVEDAP